MMKIVRTDRHCCGATGHGYALIVPLPAWGRPWGAVGLRLPAFDHLVVGLYGEVAFRQGSLVTAVSPSAGGPLTYTGSVDTRATGSLMMRLSVPFGNQPLLRRRRGIAGKLGLGSFCGQR